MCGVHPRAPTSMLGNVASLPNNHFAEMVVFKSRPGVLRKSSSTLKWGGGGDRFQRHVFWGWFFLNPEPVPWSSVKNSISLARICHYDRRFKNNGQGLQRKPRRDWTRQTKSRRSINQTRPDRTGQDGHGHGSAWGRTARETCKESMCLALRPLMFLPWVWVRIQVWVRIKTQKIPVRSTSYISVFCAHLKNAFGGFGNECLRMLNHKKQNSMVWGGELFFWFSSGPLSVCTWSMSGPNA
jgi:hypothetical protein